MEGSTYQKFAVCQALYWLLYTKFKGYKSMFNEKFYGPSSQFPFPEAASVKMFLVHPFKGFLCLNKRSAGYAVRQPPAIPPLVFRPVYISSPLVWAGLTDLPLGKRTLQKLWDVTSKTRL